MAQFDPNQWEVAFLKSIGNTNPRPETVTFVVAWGSQEGGGLTNSCSYNMLNTMQGGYGGQNCTGIGIKAYPNLQSGVAANTAAIKNGNYPSLLHAMQTNDLCGLGLCNGQMAPNVAGDMSVWLSGNRSPVAHDYIGKILNIAASIIDKKGSTQNPDPCNPLNLKYFDPAQCASLVASGQIGGPAMSETGPTAAGQQAAKSLTQCAPWDIPCLLN